MKTETGRGLRKKGRDISLGAMLGFLILAWMTGCTATGGKSPGSQQSPEGGCAVRRGLIILVEFLDVRHNINPRYPQKRFFQELNEYVREMSYGKVCIGGDVTPRWNRMPRPISQYRISPRNLEVDKSRISLLIKEALDAVDSEVRFARYSFAAIFMGAQMKEYGMMALLGPLEDGNAETLAIKVSLSETTYYLVENRQPIGFDRNLPGKGVLIMYADDQIPECRHGKSPVKLMNADPKVPYLDGAAFDMGKKENFIDPKNGLQIRLAGKVDNSYKIQIGPYRG